MQGKIKFYNETKGYGFITNTESGKDIFYHVTGLLEEVAAEDDVEFEVIEGDRGAKAINIKKV